MKVRLCRNQKNLPCTVARTQPLQNLVAQVHKDLAPGIETARKQAGLELYADCSPRFRLRLLAIIASCGCFRLGLLGVVRLLCCPAPASCPSYHPRRPLISPPHFMLCAELLSASPARSLRAAGLAMTTSISNKRRRRWKLSAGRWSPRMAAR